MADAPKLNSATDATAARYAPLSWAAVASLATAVVFVLTLLALGWNAYSNGQPLFMPLLFVLPAQGIFLAFLARRHIRNSEGARTGEGYANVGWWTCVVVGACYFAYLIANDLSVRTEAEAQMADWAYDLGKGNPADPSDPHVWRAYEGTLDPGAPMLVNPRDKKRADTPPLPAPTAAHSPQGAIPYSQFRDSPLLLVWARNRDAAKFTPNGLRNWELSPDGKLGCEVAGTLSCPEGEFPLVVPMVATTAPKTKKRSWQVMPGQRYQYAELDRASRTKYGWLIAALERGAFVTADQCVDLLHMPPPFGPAAAVDRFVAGRRDPEYTEAVKRGVVGRQMLVGSPALWVGATDPLKATAADRPAAFFTRANGQPLTDDAYARPDGSRVTNGLTDLREAWEWPSFSRLQVASANRPNLPYFRAPELAPKFGLVDTSDPARVVVKVPVDFQPRRDEFIRSRGTFSTGHLVLVCDDPAVLQELAQARQEAKDGKDKPKKEPPPGTVERTFRFRVVRLESDLLPVLSPESMQGAPGGPGGGPPGG